tara:strand:- start:180 stop:380 length:201 start_codon:yes stop_codon:yes gene_type:complete
MEREYDAIVCLDCWAHGSTPAKLAAMTGGPDEYCDWHMNIQYMNEDEYCGWVAQCDKKLIDDDGGE